MSKTFTYEIDERRLRLQLRNVDLPLKEDAWGKFEAYARAHPLEQPKRSFKNFELNLNRNVVLPVVFGIIICVFSFLLFNFISLKKPIGQTESNENPAPVVTNQDLQKKDITVKASIVPAAIREPVTLPEAEKSAERSENADTKARASSTEQTKQVVSPAEADNKVVSASVQEQKSEPIARPKRKRNSEQQLSEIRPNTVPDEEEVEVVPN